MANYVKIEERSWMVKKIGKRQNPVRYEERKTGVIIDCDEIEISIFPPPREHGKPHCHVTSKIALKINGKEVYPELKIFLEGDDDPIIITKGFASRDLVTIFDIIFNDASDGEESNDQFLIKVWEKLHGESKKS
jgi:hypothetical protein